MHILHILHILHIPLALSSLSARQHVFEPVFQFGCSLPFHAQPGLVLEHCQVAQLQLVALEYLQIAHRPQSQAILCFVHVDLQCYMHKHAKY